jgi:membrane-associated protease RseP (regulator of RpoE activity)
VSSNFPPEPFEPESDKPLYPGPAFYPAHQDDAPGPREWLISTALFLLTFLSMTFAGIASAGRETSLLYAFTHPRILVLGIPFSFTFLVILLAHELGHFLACRYYGIRCTPPYFLPLPFSFAGTLGAFIKIKAPFQHKRALFDVGIAGPLAGYAFVLPALIVGIAHSQLIPKGVFQGSINFGEPLIFRLTARLLLGYRPAHQDMIAHPIAMAAWFGLLATSLNLLPIWQLDGGHIAYAIFGRERQKRISIIAVVILIIVSLLGWPLPTYLLFGLLLLGMGLRYRFYHPPTLCDDLPLDRRRVWFGALALIILLLSFTPVPISIS